MDKLVVIKQLLLLFGIMAILVIPNRFPKYIKVVALILYFFLIFFIYSSPSFGKTTPTSKPSVYTKYPAKTALSKKALHLKLFMTKKQVIKLLGPPTWVRHEKGIRLAWIWKNGRCNPIYVTFDNHTLVNSFDEGRAICYSKTFAPLPSNDQLCSKKQNQKLCNP